MLKKPVLQLVLLGIGIYCCLIIYKLPASLLKPLVQNTPGLDIANLQGRIWQGHINNISVINDNNKTISIGQLDWDTQPLCLLLLKLCTNIQITPNNLSQGEIHGNGQLNLSLSQNIQINKLQLRTDAAWLMGMLALPISPTGHITLSANKLIIKPDNPLPYIDGTIRWVDAGVDYPDAYDLGEYALQLNTKDNSITGLLSEQGSVIPTDGDLNINENGQVNIAIRITPDNNTPTELQPLLQLIGTPNANGGYTFEQKTNLDQLFN